MRSISFAAMLFVCMLLGCGRDAGSVEAKGTHAFDPDAHGSAPAAEVQLIDPGAEPRESLSFGEGANRTLELSTTGLDDVSPGPLVVLRIAWTRLPPEGERRRYLYEVLAVVGGQFFEPEEDRLRKTLRAAFASVAGQATATNRGLDELVQTQGLNADPDPSAQLQLFAVPLPNEAIGVGATWTRPDANEQVDRYTLVAREGDTLKIDYVLTGMPETTREERTVSGSMEVSLSDPLARSGFVDFITKITSTKPVEELPNTAEFHHRVELRTLAE